MHCVTTRRAALAGFAIRSRHREEVKREILSDQFFDVMTLLFPGDGRDYETDSDSVLVRRLESAAASRVE